MKLPRSFFSRLMLSHLVIILIALCVLGLIFGYLIHEHYISLKEWKLINDGHRIARLVSEKLSGENLSLYILENNREKIETISRTSNMKLGIINTGGDFIYQSPNLSGIIAEKELPIAKAEIQEVVEGNRISKKILGPENNYLLIAFPLINIADEIDIAMDTILPENATLVGGIVIQTSFDEIGVIINDISRFILYSSLIALAAAMLTSFLFSRKVNKPLKDIQSSTLSIAQGDFKKVKLPRNSTVEIKHLVKTFNYAVEQIDASTKKQQRLERMRKEFVANVSHEFRAPLTSIRGFLELFLDRKIDQNEMREYSDIMLRDTIYLENLLSDLLVLSRLDAESIPLNKEETEPEKLLERALKSLEGKLMSKKINLKVDIDKNLNNIIVDITRIHQVIINLLANAINYSPEEGTIIVSFKNTFREHKNAVKFTVTDEGPGIPEEDLPMIWQRFYKTNSARTRKGAKGSGLGLAIVKEIIEKHGGQVEVKSVHGEGSSFSFIIFTE